MDAVKVTAMSAAVASAEPGATTSKRCPAVPPEFVKLDRAFHETSAQLAAAARAQDVGQELSIFARMTDACVTCHGRFASDRFPRSGPELKPPITARHLLVAGDRRLGRQPAWPTMS
jgi:mono/diheme cytochrome c family protein